MRQKCGVIDGSEARLTHSVDSYVQDSATREELGLLAVMDALAEQERVSQRELAQQTGLHLKKVNYCLRELLARGYVKFRRAVQSSDKRGYLYVLTPAGVRAKSRLTYQFLQSAMGYYDQVETRFGRCLQRMARAGVRRVVLCGPTTAARIVLGLTAPEGVEIVGVVSRNGESGSFHGVPVLAPEALKAADWDGVLITALEDPDAMGAWIAGLGVPEERVWRLS